MISVYAAMLVLLGFLLAALLLLVFLPAYRRRIERFATETLKRSLPLTEAEIRADKDRIRAEYAIDVHKLDMKLEDATLSAARQSVEINRREAKIHELEQAMDAQKMFVDEHENARRVLEQAIMDRLPKVEQRLSEARKMLAQRDNEIQLLSHTSQNQSQALEEATQINLQQSDELHRVRAALETRAARNRETLGDPRFDGEVALRTEIETLRAKTRDQGAVLERLQGGKEGFIPAESTDSERERLRSQLAQAEAELAALKAGDTEGRSNRQTLESKVRVLEEQVRDQQAEAAKLKAAIQSFEESAAANVPTGRDNRISAKAEISALQAEVDEHRRTIQALRAEVAGNNERLARQAQHFRDEMRRLSTSSRDAEERDNPSMSPRRSLADRIAQPRIPSPQSVAPPAELSNDQSVIAMATAAAAAAATDMRQGGFLRALSSGVDAAAAAPANDTIGLIDPTHPDNAQATEPTRRPRLLERISSIEKS